MTREEALAKYLEKLEKVYRSRTPKSRQIIEQKAVKVMPDGDFREGVWLDPYPTIMAGGHDCYLNDIEGHEYLDFHNCWTAMVWGNSPKKIVEAIRTRATQALAMGAPTEDVYEWAQMICNRVPAVERIRFCCSGTEATMFAIRAARAFTGRDKIVKMIGNFHGTYDQMESAVGWRGLPPGIPQSAAMDVLVTPYNDKASVEKIVKENKDKLAAVIVEGVMGSGGLITPIDGFLDHIRKVATENNVLMILDEVITFRLATGGAQQIFNVKPDLVTFGKTIGGGMPVGAFGGRADVMAVYSPRQKRPAHHSGTLLATPLNAAAGIAGLKEMNKENLDRINALGDSLAAKLRKTLDTLKINAQITGYGSLHQLHFTPEPVTHAEISLIKQDRNLLKFFHLGMLNRDMFIPKRGMFNISMPMTEKEINKVVEVAGEVLTDMKPLIQEVCPTLLG